MTKAARHSTLTSFEFAELRILPTVKHRSKPLLFAVAANRELTSEGVEIWADRWAEGEGKGGV